MISALSFYRSRSRLGEFGPATIIDPRNMVHDQRLRKDGAEVELMARAGAISSEAHCEAMRACRPGLTEAHLQAILEIVFRTNGSKRDAYPSIVATGNNATVLHYRANCDPIKDGDLILIDAGCEYGYLASDITRCFPANGRFSNAQKNVYQLVLNAQLAAIEKCRPGNKFQDVHDTALNVLTQGLIDLNLIAGPFEDAIKEERYKTFFWHRTSHWLGMDVHDVGVYQNNGDWQIFEPGMVLTVEPGLYFSKDNENAPDEYKGIGVRIEDDILITSEGYRVLSADVPKTITEIESLMMEEASVNWPSLG
ncbi:MAG TPA: Xaa-Pro dipeptidase [Myxococcales bacterium]|nr:Xaa-Pro dipeptidase [Myxococcales bacterium]